ncbi:protein of unknown function [Xenorhabdus poinarii G6]|uniref:Uncharacterized protein n=1 Tax=Xenorhabdus poinarii G6 TaxID=1354304 RepID=A0A068R617_9GAMM|nr:protein of unknown function [Xenorhabdus poinarii G6]CDG21839.1 protein of unknown function [Xenorhabdus poinarii G6]CDG22341.1 protein of unknown function [Xenorhabdus poinarii G6]
MAKRRYRHEWQQLEPSIEFVEKRLNIPLIAYPMCYLPDIV